MIFRKLTPEELPSWYEKELLTTFIPQECQPLEYILRLQQSDRYELWGVFDGELMLGYSALCTYPSIPLVLIDYLGVSQKHRCCGLGSEILRMLKAQGRSLVLESEEVVPFGDENENQLRKRRIEFYIRNGFKPVYRMATCGIAFQSLLFDPSGLAIGDVMKYHRKIYDESRSDVCIPLLQGQEPPMPYWVTDSKE